MPQPVLSEEASHPARPPAARRAGRVLLCGLGLGWLAELLFYDEALGISLPLFLLVLLGALYGLGRGAGVRPAWRNLWLLGPLGFFALMVALRASTVLTVLNVIAATMLLGLFAYFYGGGRATELPLRGYPETALRTLLHALAWPVRLLGAVTSWRTLRKRTGRNLAPVARGLLLSLPVLVLFGGLLASADLVFARFLRQLLSFEIPEPLVRLFWRALVVLASGWLLAGLIGYALSTPAERGDEAEGPPAPAHARPLGFVEAATLLTSVTLLFLAFVWIQFAYLFGGEEGLRETGYSYAEYARRGFLELLVVSFLTLGLLLGVGRFARFRTERQRRGFGAAGSVLAALVLVLLASAFERLLLYEQAYGYTRLRLFSHVLMLWLGGIVLWLPVTLWRPRRRFATGAFVATLGFLVTLNLINPDALIVRRNAARLEAGARLDAHYLTWLSDDAVPVMERLHARLTGAPQRTLRRHLVQRHEALEASAGRRSWTSWNLARYRARRALARIADAAAQPSPPRRTLPGVGNR